MINPSKVHLHEESGDFWHGETLHLTGPLWDGFRDRRQFTYSYRCPFRRPHSVSLGATGVVTVGIKPFSIEGPEAITNVSIIKGDTTSPRNKYYSFSMGPEDMFVATQVFDGDIGFAEVAQIGVARAVEEYRQDEHVYIWAARHFIQQVRES